MDRALREFRIRGVKTNIPFLENVIHNEKFSVGQATTTLIDTTPELFKFKPRRDRATKLLTFLGDVIVNGNPQAKGYVAKEVAAAARGAGVRPPADAAARARGSCCSNSARRNSPNGRSSRSGCSSRTRRSATRINRSSPRACAPTTCWPWPTRWRAARRSLFSLEMWGGATFDTAMRFLHEDPWLRLRALRERMPEHLFPDAVPRLERGRLFQLSGQRRRRFREARGRGGHGYFPHLRFAELSAEPQGRDGGGAGDARDLRRRRSATPATSSIRSAQQILAQVLRQAGEGTGEDGRAYSGDQGHGGPVPAGRGAACW